MSAHDGSTPGDARHGKRGSPADLPLVLSGILLFLTGFVASPPGDFWPLYGLCAPFAFWGFLEADTPLRRMTGLVLTTFCVTNGVLDFLVDLAGRGRLDFLS